jgi:hypothetical protein
VISSEASYLKSLNILISHFVQSEKFSGKTLTNQSIHCAAQSIKHIVIDILL